MEALGLFIESNKSISPDKILSILNEMSEEPDIADPLKPLSSQIESTKSKPLPPQSNKPQKDEIDINSLLALKLADENFDFNKYFETYYFNDKMTKDNKN